MTVDQAMKRSGEILDEHFAQSLINLAIDVAAAGHSADDINALTNLARTNYPGDRAEFLAQVEAMLRRGGESLQ